MAEFFFSSMTQHDVQEIKGLIAAMQEKVREMSVILQPYASPTLVPSPPVVAANLGDDQILKSRAISVDSGFEDEVATKEVEEFKNMPQNISDDYWVLTLGGDVSDAHKVFDEMPMSKNVDYIAVCPLPSQSQFLAPHLDGLGVVIWPTGVGTFFSIEYEVLFTGLGFIIDTLSDIGGLRSVNTVGAPLNQFYCGDKVFYGLEFEDSVVQVCALCLKRKGLVEAQMTFSVDSGIVTKYNYENLKHSYADDYVGVSHAMLKKNGGIIIILYYSVGELSRFGIVVAPITVEEVVASGTSGVSAMYKKGIGVHIFKRNPVLLIMSFTYGAIHLVEWMFKTVWLDMSCHFSPTCFGIFLKSRDVGHDSTLKLKEAEEDKCVSGSVKEEIGTHLVVYKKAVDSYGDGCSLTTSFCVWVMFEVKEMMGYLSLVVYGLNDSSFETLTSICKSRQNEMVDKDLSWIASSYKLFCWFLNMTTILRVFVMRNPTIAMNRVHWVEEYDALYGNKLMDSEIHIKFQIIVAAAFLHF